MRTPQATSRADEIGRDSVSQSAVERVLGRLVTDVGFRSEFFEEAASVCQHHGFELSSIELSALLRIDAQALQTLANTLDPRIVRALSLRFTKGAVRPSPQTKRSLQRGTR